MRRASPGELGAQHRLQTPSEMLVITEGEMGFGQTEAEAATLFNVSGTRGGFATYMFYCGVHKEHVVLDLKYVLLYLCVSLEQSLHIPRCGRE